MASRLDLYISMTVRFVKCLCLNVMIGSIPGWENYSEWSWHIDAIFSVKPTTTGQVEYNFNHGEERNASQHTIHRPLLHIGIRSYMPVFIGHANAIIRSCINRIRLLDRFFSRKNRTVSLSCGNDVIRMSSEKATNRWKQFNSSAGKHWILSFTWNILYYIPPTSTPLKTFIKLNTRSIRK